MRRSKYYLGFCAVLMFSLAGCGKNLNQKETTSVFGTEAIEEPETNTDATESDSTEASIEDILQEHPGAVDKYDAYISDFDDAPNGKENLTLADIEKANSIDTLLADHKSIMARNIYYSTGIEEACSYVYVGEDLNGKYTQVYTSDFDSGCAYDSVNDAWYIFDGSNDYTMIYPIEEQAKEVLEAGEKQATFLGDFEDAKLKGIYSKDGYTLVQADFKSESSSDVLKVCFVLDEDDIILEYRVFDEAGEQVMWTMITQDEEYPQLEFMEYIGNPEIERRNVEINYMGVNGGGSKTYSVPTGYVVEVIADSKSVYSDSLCTTPWTTENSDSVSGADLYKDLTLYIK